MRKERMMMLKKFGQVRAILVLCALLVLIMPIDQGLAYTAADSQYIRDSIFTHNYTLTGNGAEDIVRVAEAQYNAGLGSTLESKYKDAWCAAFVSDCAILANQSAAIPHTWGAYVMSDNLWSRRVYSPQRGDVFVIDCATCLSRGTHYRPHTGLMTSATDVIHGNYGDTIQIGTISKVIANKTSACPNCGRVNWVATYFRPNYTGSDTPVESSYDEYYKVTSSDGYLNVRSSPNGTLVGQATTGTILHITEKTTYGSYTWGYGTTSNGLEGWMCIGYPGAVEATSTPNAFNGAIDVCEGGISTIHVGGWVYNNNNVTRSITIHVYLDGTPGSDAQAWSINADGSRQDVDKVYGVGEFHGFDYTLTGISGGQHTVYIYAVDPYLGESAFLEERTINVTADTTAPTITNIAVSDITKDGYTVSCTVADDVGIDRVFFPTWTLDNTPDGSDQDDLIWYEAHLDGNTASYRVNISDHGNQRGVYYATHIYAYDTAGNVSFDAIDSVYMPVYPDGTSVSVASSTEYQEVIIAWNATANTEYYDLRIYDTSDNCIWGKSGITSTSYRCILPAGTYKMDVCTVNATEGTWTGCERVTFTVSSASVPSAGTLVKTVEADGKLFAFYDKSCTWLEAKAIAAASEGAFASITSQAQQDAIAAAVAELGRSYWLGAEAFTHYGWTWENGNAFNYSHWGTDQPDGGTGGENCLEINASGKWNDVSNDMSAGMDWAIVYGYILEYEAADVRVAFDVILPAGLTSIEDEAFMGLAFTSVQCPESLERIGANAFAKCVKLESIYIPDGCLSIDTTAFSGCTDLIIYGSSGSVAQAFAKKKGFAFVAYER